MDDDQLDYEYDRLKEQFEARFNAETLDKIANFGIISALLALRGDKKGQ